MQPEQYAADNLVARVNFVNGRLNAPVVVPRVRAARAERPQPDRPVEGPVRSGRLLASQGKYAEADASYASALQKNPGNLDAKGALETSRNYAALVKDGRSLQDKKGSAQAARKSFEDARALDAQRFDRDGLGPVLTALLRDAGVIRRRKDCVRGSGRCSAATRRRRLPFSSRRSTKYRRAMAA